MKIQVETAPKDSGAGPNMTVQVDLDHNILNPIPNQPYFRVKELQNAFSWACRVPDVWRYTLKVRREGTTLVPLTEDDDVRDWYASRPAKDQGITSRYADRPAEDALEFRRDRQLSKNAAAVRVLLLLLESPHKSEYAWVDQVLVPRAPAQDRSMRGAGRGIHECWPPVIDPLQLPKGDYLVIIANPVPYQCSLSTVMPGRPLPLGTGAAEKLRNHVWKQLFALEAVKGNFVERLCSYEPDIILNCCTAGISKRKNPVSSYTEGLQWRVTQAIQDLFWELESGPPAPGELEPVEIKRRLFSTMHPSGPWHFRKYQGIAVYEYPLLGGPPEELPFKPMKRKE